MPTVFFVLLSFIGIVYRTCSFFIFAALVTNMSSESSFDGQVSHEFDDLLLKPLYTYSKSDHLVIESTGATISSEFPPPTVPTSSQTSISPSTPGITDSFLSLEIAPVESTDCSRGWYTFFRVKI